jgi:hypothetical protein
MTEECAPHTAVMLRFKRGIQYAEASPLIINASEYWIVRIRGR